MKVHRRQAMLISSHSRCLGGARLTGALIQLTSPCVMMLMGYAAFLLSTRGPVFLALTPFLDGGVTLIGPV